MSRPPRGKVASLPAAIRERVNREMHDGVRTVTILAWLNDLPEVVQILAERFDGRPITRWNLSAWRRGGHTPWLFAATGGEARTDELMASVTARIHELIKKATPAEIPALVHSLTQLRRVELEAAKVRQRDRVLAQNDERLALQRLRLERTTSRNSEDGFTSPRPYGHSETRDLRPVPVEELSRLIFGDPPLHRAGAQTVKEDYQL